MPEVQRFKSYQTGTCTGRLDDTGRNQDLPGLNNSAPYQDTRVIPEPRGFHIFENKLLQFESLRDYQHSVFFDGNDFDSQSLFLLLFLEPVHVGGSNLEAVAPQIDLVKRVGPDKMRLEEVGTTFRMLRE